MNVVILDSKRPVLFSAVIDDEKYLSLLRVIVAAMSTQSSVPSSFISYFCRKTGDRPGSGSIGSYMAGVSFLKLRSFDSRPKSYGLNNAR